MSDTTLVLANMGGPSTTSEVEPYLRAIFADPAILPVPKLLRVPLGRWIARRRAPKVAERYRRIGGSSPLANWTRRQVECTREGLEWEGLDVRVTYAFRYTAPTVEEVLAAEARAGARRVILLPLFPHFTRAMTGSIAEVARLAAERAALELSVVRAWGARPDVLALWARMMGEAVAEAGPGARVLFVAHGIPLRSVRQGEDYPQRVAETARELARRLPQGTKWALAYQSRVGPIEWTGPYLDDELSRLCTSPDPLVLMPLSFVADCLETLYDLDVVATTQARRAGVGKVVRVSAFNDDPEFGRVLARLAAERLGRPTAEGERLAAPSPPTDQAESGGNE